MAELPELVGQVLGTSDWVPVDQERIDAFAATTEDRQWIHVDPEAAASGPYGGTVAHGMLSLSLLVGLSQQALRVSDAKAGVNYGFDRVRFPAPVSVGSRIRTVVALAEVEPVPGGLQLGLDAVVEVQGGDRPAAVARLLVRLYA